jgi:hypothetical protein
MHPLDRLYGLAGGGKSIVNANASEYEHPLVAFDVTLRIRAEPSRARLNPARLQRAPEGADQSTRRCGDDIVERRGVRVWHIAADAIV